MFKRFLIVRIAVQAIAMIRAALARSRGAESSGESYLPASAALEILAGEPAGVAATNGSSARNKSAGLFGVVCHG